MDNNNPPINQMVRGWFSNQNQQSSTPTTPTNSLVRGWFNTQNADPHPLDDTAVSRAKSDIGDQSYNNYCEAFAEQVAYGRAGIYNSAAHAWNTYAGKGMANMGDVNTAPRNSMIFFAPDTSNSGDGHVGVADGNGNFVSATSHGVKSMPIADWIKQTGQRPLGWVMPQQGGLR